MGLIKNNNNSKIRNGVLIAVITAIIVQGGNIGLIKWLSRPATNESDIAEMKQTLNSYIPIVERNARVAQSNTNSIASLIELLKKNAEKWDKQLELNGQFGAKIEMLTANKRGYIKGNPINPGTGKQYTDNEMKNLKN